MTRYSLLNDLIFQHVFGLPEHGDVLMALLNALLERRGDARFVRAQILNPQPGRPFPVWERGPVLDTRTQNVLGDPLAVQVHVGYGSQVLKRGWEQLQRLSQEEFERNGHARRILGITLLSDVETPDDSEIYRQFYLPESDPQSGLMVQHVIQLSKYHTFKREEMATSFDRWLHVLTYGELYIRRLDPLPSALQEEPGIGLAVALAAKLLDDESFRWIHFDRQKALLDHTSHVLQREGECRVAYAEGYLLGHARGRLQADGIDQSLARAIYKMPGGNGPA